MVNSIITTVAMILSGMLSGLVIGTAYIKMQDMKVNIYFRFFIVACLLFILWFPSNFFKELILQWALEYGY